MNSSPVWTAVGEVEREILFPFVITRLSIVILQVIWQWKKLLS
jgi:hypothetical protein